MPASYVLITPARNEADYIDETLQSVVAQTAPPLRWVIVSDGSTDATDEIVRSTLPATTSRRASNCGACQSNVAPSTGTAMITCTQGDGRPDPTLPSHVWHVPTNLPATVFAGMAAK